jgi:hypothetical protein
VPWRFSDAGKHRAQLKRRDAASEKPAQMPTLVDAAANFRFEPILTVSRNAANVRFRDLVFVLGRAC